jgi:hypothetical protein
MLIMTSITPVGQTGPHRDYKAFELTVYQGEGYGYISTSCFSEPVMPPEKAAGRQAQFGAGQMGSVATLFAVLAREMTSLPFFPSFLMTSFTRFSTSSSALTWEVLMVDGIYAENITHYLEGVMGAAVLAEHLYVPLAAHEF